MNQEQKEEREDDFTSNHSYESTAVDQEQKEDGLASGHSYESTIANLEQKVDNLISRTDFERGYWAALCALDWIETNVSEYVTQPDYEKLALSEKGVLEKALTTGYGLCGDKVYIFNEIMREMGFESRCIQIFNITSIEPYGQEGMTNHVVSEVRYDGKWHLFDPTFSMFYEAEQGNVLDYETLLALSPDERESLKKTNEISLHNITFPFNESGEQQIYNYFASPTKDIILSGSGTIHVNADKDNPFAQLINYLGKYHFSQDDAQAEIKLGITSDKKVYRQLVLKINRFWCLTEGDIEINIETSHGEKKLVFSKDDREKNGQEVTVDLNWPGTEDIYLSVKNADNTDGTCLVYFDSIQIR